MRLFRQVIIKIIEDVRNTPEHFPNVALTVGSFDGVHIGHQRIIDEVVRIARAMEGTAALMTLQPHPRQVFAPEKTANLLTCSEKMQQCMDAAGLDVLYVLPFTLEVANMAPEAFLRDILVKQCDAKHLIVGHDFRFGKAAQGDYEFLRDHAPAYGITVDQVSALIKQGERVSSTLIRERILQGELEGLETFLGRRYSMLGEVITGRGMGRQLGFPTANVKPGPCVVPAQGVYVAEVLLEGICYPAVVNIGVAPTIRHEDIMIEAHLLDFDHVLTGKTIEIIFHHRLRPEKKFDSYDALIEAIAQDVKVARDYFQC